MDAALVCLGLYTLVLLASPMLHHDFDCHLKAPRHCQACVANPLAPGIQPSGGLAGARLDTFGHALPLLEAQTRTTPFAPVAGRAPPL